MSELLLVPIDKHTSTLLDRYQWTTGLDENLAISSALMHALKQRTEMVTITITPKALECLCNEGARLRTLDHSQTIRMLSAAQQIAPQAKYEGQAECNSTSSPQSTSSGGSN